MLIIHGRKVINVDAPNLRKEFKRSYQRHERLGRLIENMILSSHPYRFKSAKAMSMNLVDRDANDHLNIPEQCLHEIHGNRGRFPGGVVITMTENRNTDMRRANRIAGFDETPAGYTWHHCEHIRQGSHKDEWKCTMKLVDENWHRTRHIGGVYEYEFRTGKRYR